MKNRFKSVLFAAVTAMVGTVSAVVPDCYYEWLGSSGSQYIDTGYVFKKNPLVKTCMYYTSGDVDVAGTSSAFFTLDYNGTTIYYRYGNSYATNIQYSPTVANRWVECSWAKDVYHDGICVGSYTRDYSFANNTLPFLVFRGRSFASVKFKYMDMYYLDNDDGAATTNLVRSYRAASLDGVTGFYDSVQRVFYKNANTGTFSHGDRLSLPNRLAVTGRPEEYGDVTPAYGEHFDVAAGSSFTVSVKQPTVTVDSFEYHCKGWELYRWNDELNGFEKVSSGTGTSFTYTHPDPAVESKLVWLWGRAVAIDARTLGDGTVSVVEQDGMAKVTATANEGSEFVRWLRGDLLTAEDAANPVLTLSTATEKTVTACFRRKDGVKTAKTWKTGGGDSLWTTASNWEPEGVPTLDDDVTIAGATVNIPEAAVMGGLSVASNGGLYVGSSAISGPGAVMDYETSARNRELYVDGDVSCAGTLAIGGRVTDRAETMITNLMVKIAGDLTVSGAGKLMAYAASSPAVDILDIAALYRDATVIDVAGAIQVKDTATLYPCVDELTGTPLKFACTTFALEEGAKVNANDRGWHWFLGQYADPRCRFVDTAHDKFTFAMGFAKNWDVGAGYGGRGTGRNQSDYGPDYGFAYAPFLAGSPGGCDTSGFTKSYGSGRAVRGGGAFWIRVKGTAILNGKITAVPLDSDSSAASGGGVWIAADKLSVGPNASIAATGAKAGAGTSYAGGGGRISLAEGLSDEQLDALAAGETPEGLVYYESISQIAVDVSGGKMTSGNAPSGTTTYVTPFDESKVTATVKSSIPLFVTGVSPYYGDWLVPGDEETEYTAPKYGYDPANDIYRYECLGYVVSNGTEEVASGETNVFSYNPQGENIEVYWLWGGREVKVTLAKPERGTMRLNGVLMTDDVYDLWTHESDMAVIEAVPDAGCEFLYWLGEVDKQDRFSQTLRLVPSERRVAKPFFRVVAEPADCVWNGGTGKWNDPSMWTPAQVPWKNDTVLITDGTCTIETCARAKSIRLGGTAKLMTTPTEASRLNNNLCVSVAGNFALDGSSRFDCGAADGYNTICNWLEVGGDLTLADTAVLLVSSGNRTDGYTEKTGSGFVVVGGCFVLADQAMFCPNSCGIAGGVTAVSVGGKFSVGPEAKVDADKLGFGPQSNVSPQFGIGNRGEIAAGHGGRGQSSATDMKGDGGTTYDGAYAPLWPGQENRSASSENVVRGGGAVRVKAHRILIEGMVTANGGYSKGASAGGSIWLCADTVKFGPNAVLSAKGSDPAASDTTWGASGGGRISICRALTEMQYAALVADGTKIPEGVGKISDISEEFLSANPQFADAVNPGSRAAAVPACYGTFKVLEGAGTKKGITILFY